MVAVFRHSGPSMGFVMRVLHSLGNLKFLVMFGLVAGSLSAAVGQPVPAKPAVGQPVPAKPAVSQPVPAKPAVVQPVPAKPVAGQPVPAKPAVTQPGGVKPVSFINDIAPLFKENCFGCHGSKNPKGKLDMTRFESLRKGGTKEDPVVNGKPDESHLIDVLQATDASRMPPRETGSPLAAAKIALIEKWIAEGAKIDQGLDPKADLVKELRRRWSPPALLGKYSFPVSVTALTYTPDGKQLISSGHHELCVWDVESGKLVKRVAIRSRRAMALVFLPDGKLVMAGGRPGEEGDVSIYDLNAPAASLDGGVAVLNGITDPRVLIRRLLEADDEVECLSLSADGKKIAAGGCDRLIQVWDLSAGIAQAKLTDTIENHADWVFGVAFFADGNRLASASRDKTAKVWDLKAKESVATFPEHQSPVFGVVVKADGSACFSAGDDKQVRAWNLTGDQGAKQLRAMGGSAGAVLKMVQHGKEPWLVSTGVDNKVRVWDREKGNQLLELAGHKDYVLSLAINPAGNVLASGSWDGEIRLWNLKDGKLLKTFNASPGLVVAIPKP